MVTEALIHRFDIETYHRLISDELPKGEDVLLIIEVADTSLDYDRKTKVPMYAQAKIQEVWLVNLLENCIEIYSSPSSSGYEFRRTARQDQAVTPMHFPDICLTANQILGI